MGSAAWTSLPFGAGLDRATGVGLLDPSTFRDLRNLDLQDGRVVARRGFEARTALSLDGLGATPMTDVALLTALRAEAQGLVVGYEDVSRKVQVFTTSAVGLNPVCIGTWGTPPADAGRVICSGAESYRKLFLAHDHAQRAKRLKTVYYDPTVPGLVDLTADLDGAGAVPVYFRGVQRYLNYLWGWGYGSASDPDRPEILRVSLAGQPHVLRGEYYFLIGSPAEAVLGLAPLQGFAMALKQTELHRIEGASRADFRSIPADASFGVAGARLWAVAEGALWFWSLEGPRVTTGGASEDIGIPLDSNGPSPEDLVAAGDVGDGFAVYRRDLRVVEFHFGRRCYVLHLRDRQRLRWSYRENGVELRCAGTFYVGSGTAAPTGFPSVGALVPTSGTLTVPLTYTGATGDETLELWLQQGAGAWSMVRNAVIANLVGENIVLGAADGIVPSTTYTVAARFRRGLFYTDGYTSTNPADWPASARATATTDVGSGTPADVQFLGGTVTSYGVKKYNHPFFSWTANPPGVSTSVLVSQRDDPDEAVVLTTCPFAQTESDPAGNFLVQSTPSLRWFFVAHRQADGTLGPPAACARNPINVSVEMGV